MKVTRLREGYRIHLTATEFEALAAVASLGVLHIEENGVSARARNILKSERWQSPGGPLTIDDDRKRRWQGPGDDDRKRR
jgi:hypothetical protein